MPGSPALQVVCRVRAMSVALALAACGEAEQPDAIALIQAASNPDGDGQQVRASLAGGALRGQFQMYFGDRFADEERGLMPQAQMGRAPTD